MKAESFLVIGDAANKDLGKLVKEKLNAFLEANPELTPENTNVVVDSDLSTTYGKALVVVTTSARFGNTPEKAAKGKK